MIRLIIAGGRYFGNRQMEDPKEAQAQNAADHQMFTAVLRPWEDASKQLPLEVVEGGAPGADTLGRAWGRRHADKVTTFRADWNKYGRRAGPIRNVEMAEYGNVLVAFWDGESRGTKHMIYQALSRGLEVHVYRYE